MFRRLSKVMLLDCQTALIQDVILIVIKAQRLVMEFMLSTQTLEKSQCVLKIQKNLGNGVILVSLQNSKLIPKRLSISYNEGFSGNIVAIQYGKVLHISRYVTSEQSGSQLTAALIPGVQLFANGFQLIFQTDDKKICTFGTLTKDGSIIIGPCEKNVYRFNAAAFIK